MREAADYMIGPKNFTSFTDDSENKDPVRRVTNIKIVSNGCLLYTSDAADE